MERALELRENAERCLRLSKGINSPADVACLEAVAAEAIKDAERIEADVLATPDADQTADTWWDRRRPGRRDDVIPMLIPLLRGHSFNSVHDERDQLRAPRGILTWAAISTVVWAVVVFVFRLWL